MDEWAVVRKVQDLVYNTYLNCSVQKRAVRAVITTLQKADLVWTHEGEDGKTYKKKIDLTSKEHKIWSNFVAQLVVQLKVFGYALYRMVRVRQDKRRRLNGTMFIGESTETQPENVRLEVANSQGVLLQWDDKRVEWSVYSVDGTALDEKAMKKAGWNLLMLNEPNRVGPTNVPVLNSAAANCQRESMIFSNIKNRIDHRDGINSKPMVYTTVSKHLVQSGTGTRPWFTNPSAAQDGTHINVPGESQDFNSLLAGRLETLRDLDRLSKKARESTRKAYETLHRPKLGKKPQEKPTYDATEMFISDGRDFGEMTHRRGPDELHQTIDHLMKEILFTHEVTPQSFGMSGGSERLTSNDRLAQIAIVATEEHKTLVMATVQDALRKMSSQLSGDKSGRTFVKMWPCISAYNLSQIEAFLDPDFAMEAHACIHQIPVSAIDRKAYVKHQEILLLGQPAETLAVPTADGKRPVKKAADTKKKAADVDAGGNTVRPEPRMSEAQKSARRDAKAQA